MSKTGLDDSLKKLREDGASLAFCNIFEHFYHLQENANAGLSSEFIREADVRPLNNITKLSDLPDVIHTSNDGTSDNDPAHAIDDMVAIIKLNGGLGTTMGLTGPKSLLTVRDNLTFLDIILKSILKVRKNTGARLPLLFMNSYNTSEDTFSYIYNHLPGFFDHQNYTEFIQHRHPKLYVDSLEPVTFPLSSELEWCPPGHGDFYSSIYDSGVLEGLLNDGFKYAFVSNADNLGAIYDSRIAHYFASSGKSIMLELTPKTDKDIKGGHIVIQNGRNILREVAQIHPDDLDEAFNRHKHPYFNTNSIWLDLEQLHEFLSNSDGIIDLPLITNIKNVRPKDETTPKCIQMEYAIGAGVNALPSSTFLNVPRSRFIGVKTHEDLAALQFNDDLTAIIDSIS